MWLTMEKLSEFIINFSKKHGRKILSLFHPTSTVCIAFFKFNLLKNMWLISHFNKFLKIKA